MKKNLPVIVLRGIVLLPNNDIRLEFENDSSKNIIDEAQLLHDNEVLVVSQIDPLEEKPLITDLPKYGIVAKLNNKIELPNGKIRVILTGLYRASVIEYLKQENEDDTLESIICKIEKEEIESKYEKSLIKKLYREIDSYIKFIPYVSNSIISSIENINDLDKMTDIIVPYLQIANNKFIEYLEESSSIKRMEMILKDIYDEKDMFQVEREIDSKIKKELDQNQKEFILREKMKAIKSELGDTSVKDIDIVNIEEKLENLKAPDKIKNRIYSEIKRYQNMNQSSPEENIIRNYIEWMLNLPWNNYTIDNDDLIDVREKLDKSHNGLEEVKNRIVEYLAVKQMTNSLRSPILCLVGPPGVGKTSLAFSIANAMNRNFIKMSVGGVNDEAEIVGHRRTYMGASPGRVIQAIKKAKSSNPVFLIDEIDKMTYSYKGDPASTLLEILDPEQNKYFSDNYIEEEYDLSKVMFIATANNIEDIPTPLKDRLEIVYLSGYTEYEKVDIAKKYLLPKICKEHGVNVKGIEIKDEVILKIINCYTKEAGVRDLERKLATIIRKIVTAMVVKRIIVNKFIIDNKKIKEFLGVEKYTYNSISKKAEVGVVNGLAYTPFGGDILPIEVNYFKGTGNLILTGSLGNVMKESATIALNYIKSNYKYFNIDYNLLINNDIHINVPETAIPKDGPSAGITLTTAIISALTNNKISSAIAMTGEITLRGKVLAIGGLKEKSIGAHRNNIKNIIIPYDNLKDLEEVPIEIKNEINYIPVKTYKDIYKYLNKEIKEEVVNK